jgi:hypothetical protein
MKPGTVPAAAALMGLIAFSVPANAAPLDARALSAKSAMVELSAVTKVHARQRHYRRSSSPRTWRKRRHWVYQRHLYRPYYLDSPYYYSTSFNGYPFISRQRHPFRSWDRGAIYFRQR